MRGIVGGLLVVALAASACAGDDGDRAATDATGPIDACDWPLWGYGIERTFATTCDTALAPDTVGDLQRVWFHATDDVVTATPAVVGDTVYTGDWAGVVYALDRETGEERWRFQTTEHRNVYAGQIVSSPAVADVDGERLVVIGAGKTLYGLVAADGTERWHHELGEAGDAAEPTEIESSPVVVDGLAVFGYDVHNTPGYRAGLQAVDVATGDLVWDVDLDREGGHGGAPTGCVDVWSSPSVDRERGLVFAATGNCPSSPEGWGGYTEALFAVDLEGNPVWSFQPHEPNNDDLDFAGAPNLFRIGDRDVVGLGNKDGTYYVVDRETGEPVWQAEATEPGLEAEGSNFSTGGFIGGSAVSDGVVTGDGRRPLSLRPRHRRRHRGDPLAERRAGRHLRLCGGRQRRAVPGGQRLHPSGSGPGHRRDPLVRGDAGRGVRWRRGERRRPLRRGRDPGARSRRAFRDQRRVPVLARGGRPVR